MQLDPDNETEYRRGGKIMKKTPRKFSAGGTPTPRKYEPPKPTPGNPRAPKLGDDDFVSPETQESMRRQKEEEKFDEAQRKRGAQRPNLGKLFKKGGKVKKYEDGGMADNPYRNDPESPGDTGSLGRFEDDTYRRAYEQVNRLRLPPGAAAEKDYEGGTKSAPKAAPKAAPRKFSAPKPAPKKEAPKETVTSSPKVSSDASLSRGLGAKFAAMDKALSGATPGMGGYEALKKARDDAKTAYDKASASEKTGKSVVKLARGGGVERKGKTSGKIVKMAKGGSVRGYGISKVTNKTRYV
jgi:hypothetical protein